MKNAKTILVSFLLILATAGAFYAGQPDQIIWVDYDFANIPEPKERKAGVYDSAFRSEFVDPIKRATDIPRWVRAAAGNPKQAANVNALDEVPDSSWFTNRHALRPMSVDALVRGPNRGAPPNFSDATITRVKDEGVTPGLQVTDANGQEYMIKFDNAKYPELQSAAEVISTKILYASGYNVPENYVAYLEPGKLKIKDGVQTGGKEKRAFTHEDLAKMLRNAARRPDGTYRVLASELLQGKPKGPFSYVGLRADDPNDLIPHEHRRELRGLRVIASWINNWDAKEGNTLDMYVDEGRGKFLRHYLIDFGSSLGGGKTPTEYFHGREYAFDKVNILKELFTLGFAVTPDEKEAPLVSPEIGIFSADDFSPADWKPSFQSVAFDNMTRQDAMWATRIILSFTEKELRSIVSTAEYSNPKATEYMLHTLLERRQQIAAYWLGEGSSLAYFAVLKGKGGGELTFEDLLARHDLTAAPSEYRYEIWDGEAWKSGGSASNRRIAFDLENGNLVKFRLRAVRENKVSRPVVITVQNKGAEGWGIARIERS